MCAALPFTNDCDPWCWPPAATAVTKDSGDICACNAKELGVWGFLWTRPSLVVLPLAAYVP